jgi:hypothetical protein
MSWEVIGHAKPERSKWALSCAGLLFIGALGLGQGMVSSRDHRLLGPPADTEGWAIRFSQPAFMHSDRTESVMLFIDASMGRNSPAIRIIRLKDGPKDDVASFCGELWRQMFGSLAPEGGVATATVGGHPAWELVSGGEAEIIRFLTTPRSETYVFTYTAGSGPRPERARARFDAVCDSVQLGSP